MENIPEEIWLCIFDHLQVEDRKTARRVSKQWNQLLTISRYLEEEVLRLDHRVTQEEFFEAQTRSFSAIEITERFKWENEGILKSFLTSVGGATTTLTIVRFSTDMIHFLPLFPNIEKLVLENENVEENLEALTSLKGSLRHVKELVIREKWQTYNNNEVCESLKRHFESLKEMFEVIRVPILLIHSDIDLWWLSDGLREFCKRHLTAGAEIKTPDFDLVSGRKLDFEDVLEFHFFGITVHEEYREFLVAMQKFTNLRKLATRNFYSDECYFIHEKLNFPSVLEVGIFVMDEDDEELHKCLECKRFILESCPRFKKWYTVMPPNI